jgi:UDP-N-acetylglucosamine 2-epimerase (non-hydrolysing)
MVLVTAHRRENFGRPINDICKAIQTIARQREDVYFVYPVHLNPNIQKPVYEHLSDMDNVLLTEPLNYIEFVQLMKKAHIILTDSGGLQEESPSLGKPVLVLREVTERPEARDAGAIEIVGTDAGNIARCFNRLIDDNERYRKMAEAENPYGDGTASQKIVRSIMNGV